MDMFRTQSQRGGKDSEEVAQEDFHEFDEVDPAYKYSSKAQGDSFGDEQHQGEDEIEIRPPTSAGEVGSSSFR